MAVGQPTLSRSSAQPGFPLSVTWVVRNDGDRGAGVELDLRGTGQRPFGDFKHVGPGEQVTFTDTVDVPTNLFRDTITYYAALRATATDNVFASRRFTLIVTRAV